MKKIVIGTILSFAAIVAVYQFYYADPNIVDRDYLSSEIYQALQESIEYEKRSIADKESALQLVVQQMLAESDKFKHGLPYRLDSLSLDSVLKPANRLSIPDLRVMTSDFKNYNFYGLTIFEEENYTAVLSVIELPGVYRNLEVGLTTIKDGEIIDTALIGRYEKNITQSIGTEIYIHSHTDIRVKMNKSRFYPFEQALDFSYNYRITKDGRIESNVL